MGGLSPAHLLIILVVVLLVIGPGKLPETGAALGRALREFRGAVDGKDETAMIPSSTGSVAATAAPVAPPTTDGATTADPGPTTPSS
jgi:sec-independent protein translocase protein TatA